MLSVEFLLIRIGQEHESSDHCTSLIVWNKPRCGLTNVRVKHPEPKVNTSVYLKTVETRHVASVLDVLMYRFPFDSLRICRLMG